MASCFVIKIINRAWRRQKCAKGVCMVTDFTSIEITILMVIMAVVSIFSGIFLISLSQRVDRPTKSGLFRAIFCSLVIGIIATALSAFVIVIGHFCR